MTQETAVMATGEVAAQQLTPVAASPAYLTHLTAVEDLTLITGESCEVWELEVPTAAACLSEWASRFRQTYCPDSQLDLLRDGTGKSRAQYLLDLVFPDRSTPPGPGVRSGDFAELLIADFIEFLHGYWVPRSKYGEKGSRNESVKGVDIVGFKCRDAAQPQPSDEMLTFEVKAQLSGGKYEERLQVAVKDSAKDYLRAGETLAAMKRRMLNAGEGHAVQVVQRFQSPADRPYKLISGAAAVLSDDAFNAEKLQATSVAEHNNAKNLKLVVVRGRGLMALAHALYQQAADEA
jgi:hypothetical protein